MTLRSAARGAYYLARDIVPALRRMASPPDDDNPDAYAEHLARLHADALAEREAETEVAEPDERLMDCGLGVPPALYDTLASAAPGTTSPDAAADGPADVHKHALTQALNTDRTK